METSSAQQDDDVVAEFHQARQRLVSIAYGIIGDLGEAEDVVQEAWLRLGRTSAEIDDVTGWLVVTTSRLALDVVRSARHRRENYVGPWLPEPLVSAERTAPDPADTVSMAESVSMAMLVVLETLTPAERTAFVLHEVFGLPFTEIAEVVGRTPAAVRQLAARARRHVRERAPRSDADPARQREVTEAFAAACQGADLTELLRLLDPDVVLRSDGGGLVRAARNAVLGADKVARFLAGVQHKTGFQLQPVLVNGWSGLLMRRRDSSVFGAIAVTVAEGRITAVDMVLNPDKLARVRALGEPGDQ
ncbi:RNA polymerase sigma factor SigJ [Goodfellowiella coeruleoviolacea]|uniref:RNA polymerase sigma factor SigJ n=1 Tax=Goodfellowiella coeruleoviolacea TaxID=334858 RepID=UPI0020A52BB5|nr:RNA polymerase sigma factor SigJ [Goodfellowiella coeruleoviolacea]